LLSKAGLATLRDRDLFMYYSLPNVRSAEFRGQPVDRNTLTNGVGAGEGTTVSRNQRLSVECHPNMMMVEMFNNEEYLASLGYVRRQS
jgi:hypothetical protein